MAQYLAMAAPAVDMSEGGHDRPMENFSSPPGDPPGHSPQRRARSLAVLAVLLPLAA